MLWWTWCPLGRWLPTRSWPLGSSSSGTGQMRTQLPSTFPPPAEVGGGIWWGNSGMRMLQLTLPNSPLHTRGGLWAFTVSDTNWEKCGDILYSEFTNNETGLRVGLLAVGLSALGSCAEAELGSLNVAYLVPTCLIGILLIAILFSLSLQPVSKVELTFKVNGLLSFHCLQLNFQEIPSISPSGECKVEMKLSCLFFCGVAGPSGPARAGPKYPG